jgi:hypothetical protein
MFWYFLQLKALCGSHLFKKQVVALSFFTKPVVVTNDYCMGLKFSDQEVGNIIFGGLIGKCVGKRNNDQVINAKLFRAIEFFLRGYL